MPRQTFPPEKHNNASLRESNSKNGIVFSDWKNYLWIPFAILGGIWGYWQDRALYTAVAVPYAIERQIIDAVTFGKLGQQLWQGHPEVLYATPYNQAGPLQNLSNAVIVTWAHYIPYPYGWATIHILISTILLLAAGGVAWWGTSHLSGFSHNENDDKFTNRLKVPQRWLWTIPLIAVCLFIMLSSGSRTFTDGHWWQIFVVFLWYMGGWFALRQHPFIAGILVGISIGYEPWGVFGVLILILLSSTWKNIAKAFLSATVTALIIWGPFFGLWNFALLEYKWSVLSSSMWAPILSTLSESNTTVEEFPWTYRVIQAFLIIGIFLLSTWKWRKSILTVSPTGIPLFLLLPPLIIMLRVSTDVWFGAYYVITAQTFLFPGLLVGLLLPGKKWNLRAICSFGATYFLLLSSGLPGSPFLYTGVATILVIITARLLIQDTNHNNSNHPTTLLGGEK